MYANVKTGQAQLRVSRRMTARVEAHWQHNAKNTSDIAQRAQQGAAGDGLFADNTLGAIRQGAEHALAALIERAVGAMRRALNETPKLLVTGGASDRVEKAIGLPYRAVPDLVLQGLAVLAREPRR